MISITFNTTTQAAKLTSAATIKTNSDVPITVTLSSAVTVESMQFAIGTETGFPDVLAFTDTFTSSSATVWTATIDTTDSRLIGFFHGKKSVELFGELVLMIDGELIRCPNIEITIEHHVIDGPETSEGGPVYLSEGQSDLKYVQIGSGTSILLPAVFNLIAEGDSITAQQPSPAGSYDNVLVGLSAFDGKATRHNVALNGDTLVADGGNPGITSEYPSQVAIYKPSITGIPAILFVRIGSNDLINAGSGFNVTTFMANLEAYWAQAKADGFTVVAFTITPRMDYPATEPFRLAVNKLIRKSTTWDHLIDPALMFPDWTDTDLYSDGVHPTSKANVLLAKSINAMFSAGCSPESILGPGEFAGNISAINAGSGLRIKEGANCRIGTATLSSGFVTVANTSVTANTRVHLTRSDFGASSALGPILCLGAAVTPGVGFSIRAATTLGVIETGDNSVVRWHLIDAL